MNKKAFLLEMRQTGKLKGLKPCYISLKFNSGKIYNGGNANFIMSLRNGTLYFQKYSKLFSKLQPSGDFSVNAKRFKDYTVIDNKLFKILSLKDSEGFSLEIYYNIYGDNTLSTIENIDRIVSELKDLYGLKLLKEDDKNEQS